MQHLQLTWSTVDKPEMQQNECCSKVNQFLQTTVRDPCTNVFWITAATQPGLANSGTAATETELHAVPSAHLLPKHRGIDSSRTHAKLDMHPGRAAYVMTLSMQSVILPPLGKNRENNNFRGFFLFFLTYNFKAD